MQSILNSIKKLLGIGAQYNAFDADVIININSALATLCQAGAGPEFFSISGDGENWDQFSQNPIVQELSKQYVYLKVKMIFDPPTSSTVMDAMNRQSEELIWRINVQTLGGENA